jgi:hypothetical protein
MSDGCNKLLPRMSRVRSCRDRPPQPSLGGRIDQPDKHWKFSTADVTERGFWQRSIDAHEHCPQATSTDETPWYVVPADDRLIVSQVVLDTAKSLHMAYPITMAERQAELQAIRKVLEA